MAAEVGVMAQSANKFALDLHEILKNEDNLVNENLFYSPASLIALAMTCFGPRGKTAEELASVLHLMPDSSSGPPGGGGYSHTLPIRVCAAQRGRDFEAPDLERGIHFRGVF